MSTTAQISETASELDRLLAGLSGPELRGLRRRRRLSAGAPGRGGSAAGPRAGRPAPVARRTGRRRGGPAVDVRVDEVTRVRFARMPSLFPARPGQEVLTVQFLGPGGQGVLHCLVDDLYDGQRMRPEKLQAWRALRERYGNRDESRVDRGTLLPPAA